ncbi:hypothetical protein RHMOL_Rhmol02G0148900 [Rhododendron molle]|uniref:Uncharacterized protein n=1 Tax=Rhododendron molle TaxID=49168 RepID=A0ACC0PQ05_RHOML|nr:hypothetical protein RHMOL_Rhmol02G0148900 [Rhododendron molle]
MEKSLILFCKYNGLCAGVRLSRSLRIGDLMKILCGKFSELRRHSLQLFYAIRDHPITMLYNDEDLEVMFAVADSIGLNCIEVTVVDSRGFDSGTSGCGGDVGANSSGVFESGGDVGGSTSKGIPFSGQGLVGRRLESMGDVVVHFLSELPNERWANVFFPGQRYGAISSSLAECFNSWILKERELPVVDMVDRIRKKMMKSMCLRRERASKWEQVYSKPIYPVASLWKGDVADCGTSILPPLSKKPLGRPKKKRIHSNGEKVRKMKCGRRGKMGNHNKLTCKEDLRPSF